MDKRLDAMRRCFKPRQWFMNDGDVDPYVLSDEEAFMWVYKRGQDGSYEVGYFAPDGAWFPESSFACKDKAAERVNYLNGGKK